MAKEISSALARPLAKLAADVAHVVDLDDAEAAQGDERQKEHEPLAADDRVAARAPVLGADQPEADAVEEARAARCFFRRLQPALLAKGSGFRVGVAAQGAEALFSVP